MTEQAFVWEPQPEAMRVVRALVDEALGGCAEMAALSRRMKAETGTKFIDWVDTLFVPEDRRLTGELLRVGFESEDRDGVEPGRAFVHNGGLFPTIVLSETDVLTVGIKVESVQDYLAAHGQSEVGIGGGVGMPLRTAVVAASAGYELAVIERRGATGYAPMTLDASLTSSMSRHYESLRLRPRAVEEASGFDTLLGILDDAVDELGVDIASDLFFRSERAYWMQRNRAARVQYERQQSLGLGWANHDHHTYRSSRTHYTRLISVLERVGMICRERFYAGEEAGWGAQVLEQPRTGFVVFADVDMDPDEVAGDFAHEGFRARDELGTVGLWCGLHGEAVLEAGMHHLECQFDWHALVEQLERDAGIKTMDPFTTFPHLRQAFTEGERWRVKPERVRALLASGRISAEEAAAFGRDGAIGSHLENLERNDGYKGFNQQGVSDIIARTDPRRLAGLGG